MEWLNEKGNDDEFDEDVYYQVLQQNFEWDAFDPMNTSVKYQQKFV